MISEADQANALLRIDRGQLPTPKCCTHSREDLESSRRYFLKQLGDFNPLFNWCLTQNLRQLFATNEAGFVGIPDRFWD